MKRKKFVNDCELLRLTLTRPYKTPALQANISIKNEFE